MKRLGNVRIEGASGNVYKFRAYPLETKFMHVGAIYFITSRHLRSDRKISHSRIYCGQTSDLSKLYTSIAKIMNFQDYDANCVCILPRVEEALRVKIESDIHSNYTLLHKRAG